MGLHKARETVSTARATRRAGAAQRGDAGLACAGGTKRVAPSARVGGAHEQHDPSVRHGTRRAAAVSGAALDKHQRHRG